MTKRRRRAMDSRETGLVLGLMFGRYFFDSEDLHYGLWPDGLEVRPGNLRQAQENHSAAILGMIPEGVRSVLDVGCGAGAMAKRLRGRGYEVECVSPSGPLTAEARKTLGPETPIHPATFEAVEPGRTYDLILFSESYQYIEIEPSLRKAGQLLEPGGYMLICDFFRRSGGERGPIRGGHRMQAFQEELARHPFECLADRDITKETARNYDLLNDMLERLGRPAWDLAFAYGRANFPRLTRLVRRLYRKKLAKIEGKYFEGRRTAATFTRYKTYRLLLYRYRPVGAGPPAAARG